MEYVDSFLKAFSLNPWAAVALAAIVLLGFAARSVFSNQKVLEAIAQRMEGRPEELDEIRKALETMNKVLNMLRDDQLEILAEKKQHEMRLAELEHNCRDIVVRLDAVDKLATGHSKTLLELREAIIENILRMGAHVGTEAANG